MFRTTMSLAMIAPLSTWLSFADCHGDDDLEGNALNGAVTAEFEAVGTGGAGSNLPQGPWMVEVREWHEDDWTQVHSFARVAYIGLPGAQTGASTSIGTQLRGAVEMRVTTRDGRSCTAILDGEGWAGVPPVVSGSPWTRTWVDAEYAPTGGVHYQCTLSETGSNTSSGDTYTQCRTHLRPGTNSRVRLNCHRLVAPVR